MARVLIVDDERSIRTTLAEFVREEGHEVLTAEDVDAALQLLAEVPIDVVVTDIILPRVTGVALLEKIRMLTPDTQVVMITGEPTVESAAEAVRRGAFDYLSKPISRGAIKATVASAVRIKAIADERRRLETENIRYREHLEEEVQRKTLELHASEERYRTFIMNANEAVFVAQDDRFRFFNPKAMEIVGLTEEKLRATSFTDLIHSEDRDTVALRDHAWIAGDETPTEYSFRIVDGRGITRWIEVRPVAIEWEGRPATLNFGVDVTERTETLKALGASERKWRELFENLRDGWVSTDMDGHFLECNRAFEVLVGYSVDELRSLRYQDLTPEKWRAFEESVVLDRIAAKGYSGVYEKEYVRKGGLVFPVELSSYLIRDDEGNPIGMWGLARDISERVVAHADLRKALDGTIEAIGRATETRDPYTAGHQRQVTDLALAIASELGLDEERLEATRAAGLMHDIGKLSIPAEILSKPNILSSMEMELMKSHSQAGYDILRTVDFPWPIAEIVLQHHERIDGSGYPRGIAGDEICIEARILAVADVVEAMASHRPYRPSLGIVAALEEVVDGRNTLYDPEVVDACVRLFEEKRFAFRS